MFVDFFLSMVGNRKAKKRQMARIVKSCFYGVDWTRHEFVSNGHQMTAGSECKFYKAGEIDKGIKKLNKLLDRLS